MTYTTLSLVFFGDRFPRSGEEYLKTQTPQQLQVAAAKLLGCPVASLVYRRDQTEVKDKNSFDDSFFVKLEGDGAYGLE